MSVHFTLHTDPRAEVPELTISCCTYGGPATTVTWSLNGHTITIGTSQVILDTLENAVYDNRWTVKGRKTGIYRCLFNGGLEHRESVTGINTHFLLL